MEILEIILLILGACIFVASFLIPAKRESETGINKETAKEEVRSMVEEEMEQIKQQVDEAVEEAVVYAMEKTERSLERISNEKIMAVSEYSDTVLTQINKNHQEVMFLYDMLNDKHSNLTKTASVVEKKAKEAEAIVNEAFQTLKPEPIQKSKGSTGKKTETNQATKGKSNTNGAGVPLNSNETILALYNSGKSSVQIAKELGLGVGEVDLVIGLFKEK